MYKTLTEAVTRFPKMPLPRENLLKGARGVAYKLLQLIVFPWGFGNSPVIIEGLKVI
jgi:hypothetical protein